MKKRLLTMLLAVCLMFALGTVTAMADDAPVTHVSTPEAFREAIEKDEGGTIILDTDITMDGSVTVGGFPNVLPTNVVLDLNGKTLRFELNNWMYKTGIAANSTDTRLTIRDSSAEQTGQIVSDKTGDLYLLHIQNGATVEFQSGKIVSESGANYIIMLGKDSDQFGKATLIINGGSIVANGYGWTSTANGGQVFYNGGTINTKSEITAGSDGRLTIAPGMELSNADGTYTLVEDADSETALNYAVADAKFETLQQAVDAIGTSGTITLLNDEVTETQGVTIPSGVDITLDLGGKTLSLNGTVTTVDSEIADTQKNTFNTNIQNNGTLNLINGFVESTTNFCVNYGEINISDDVDIKTLGNIIVNLGGTLNTSGNLTMSGEYNAIETYGGEVNVSGGTISATSVDGNYEASAIAIFNREYNTNTDNGAVVNISGGTINSRSYAASINNQRSRGSVLNITGGELTSFRTAIYWPASLTLNIGAEGTEGPIITSTNGSAVEICTGTLNVYSGTLNGGTNMSVNSGDRYPTDEALVDMYRQYPGSANMGDAITVIANRSDTYAEAGLNVSISGGSFTSSQNYAIRYMDCNTTNDEQCEQEVDVEVSGGEFSGEIAAVDASFVVDGNMGFISGGNYSNSLPKEYLGDSLNAELYSVRNSNTPYSYYTDVQAAQNIAQAGDIVTDLSEVGDNAQKVSVVINDGVGGANSIEVADGSNIILPEAPERDGYSFAGWSDGNGKVYDAGDVVPVSGNVTFTAVWREIKIPTPHEITIANTANGTVDTSLSNASAGAVITITATPNSGYGVSGVAVTGPNGTVAVTRVDANTYTFVMPDGPVTVSVTFGNGLPFTDVTAGQWFYDYVEYVYVNGLMNGTSATTFEPNANMTRAMVWAILARIDGETVTGESWQTVARTWAMANGVSDGSDPNGLVTREQFATMLWRYAGEPASSYSLSAYSDAASVSDWAETAMAWAVEHGIITGMTDTTLVPQGSATRAQCAAMLMRFVEL